MVTQGFVLVLPVGFQRIPSGEGMGFFSWLPVESD
jgi:hypothetical protein